MSDASEDQPKRIDCVLIAAGKYHDIDFARLELLKLLGEDMRFRVRVFEDYENLEALKAADCIVTYTWVAIHLASTDRALQSDCHAA